MPAYLKAYITQVRYMIWFSNFDVEKIFISPGINFAARRIVSSIFCCALRKIITFLIKNAPDPELASLRLKQEADARQTLTLFAD